jgi:hypothetical protein
VSGGDPDDSEALHGTFIVDRNGLVRWAHVGDRPFKEIEVLLAELYSPTPKPGESPPSGENENSGRALSSSTKPR